jgi:hypothetical protein
MKCLKLGNKPWVALCCILRINKVLAFDLPFDKPTSALVWVNVARAHVIVPLYASSLGFKFCVKESLRNCYV